MDAFLNQLVIVFLVIVVVVLAYATYKVVYKKMNQVDASEIATQPAESAKAPKTRPVIRARAGAIENTEEKGESEDDGLTKDVADNA